MSKYVFFHDLVPGALILPWPGTHTVWRRLNIISITSDKIITYIHSRGSGYITWYSMHPSYIKTPTIFIEGFMIGSAEQ